jgi:phosphoribosyl-ATP pyrophosphohydrolase/phosphoribosyl-AMP cyclohydrolase
MTIERPPLHLHLDAIDFAKGGGTIVAVAQHAVTGAVLMVAFADREAVERTLATGEMHFRSRTRGLWKKGETSGHVLRVESLAIDCDGDALLARALPVGPTCHTGSETCFGPGAGGAFDELDRVIAARADAATEGGKPSYTQRLLGDRNLRLKKLGEEQAELVTALADADQERSKEEAADVVYHVAVALRALGLSLADVGEVLRRRAR